MKDLHIMLKLILTNGYVLLEVWVNEEYIGFFIVTVIYLYNVDEVKR